MIVLSVHQTVTKSIFLRGDGPLHMYVVANVKSQRGGRSRS